MSTQEAIENRIGDQRRKRRRWWIIAAAVVVIAIVAAILVPRLLSSSSAEDGDLIPISIADTSQSTYQDAVIEVGRENGLDISFVNFDDPNIPNRAVLDGEVDANAFQHLGFLSTFNAESDADITPVFAISITTYGLFSDKHDSLESLPDGARIAISEDPSNFSRSLFILESAGLIEVDDAAGLFPTEADITSNPKNLELVPLAYASVHTAYTDPAIDGVVIAVDDFDPALGLRGDDALALEDPTAESSQPYAIVLATTAERADDPVWDALEKTYRDERVEEAFIEEKNGLSTLVEIPSEDLRDTLASISEEYND
ncbi:MetQ/NlpA family ABC transporter substrate-binding protein [Gulosibacter sp. 10]|uniref:MetQ/NlpA family ABC transporter substrate-binding protein n=1 Tax=Gulosibacter sp. 10 TaxID=1255570 RepID=UPI00097ECB5D|nr:MetQ/NlpA family ABC transporter substrate-binding protein [Gulosibacter sp. 10]SJM55972.1 Methionine ABC transporter substrate-binding protein [Gulosibacter sp. 10]